MKTPTMPQLLAFTNLEDISCTLAQPQPPIDPVIHHQASVPATLNQHMRTPLPLRPLRLLH
jgi:hypothetical protein